MMNHFLYRPLSRLCSLTMERKREQIRLENEVAVYEEKSRRGVEPQVLGTFSAVLQLYKTKTVERPRISISALGRKAICVEKRTYEV